MLRGRRADVRRVHDGIPHELQRERQAEAAGRHHDLPAAKTVDDEDDWFELNEAKLQMNWYSARTPSSRPPSPSRQRPTSPQVRRLVLSVPGRHDAFAPSGAGPRSRRQHGQTVDRKNWRVVLTSTRRDA